MTGEKSGRYLGKKAFAESQGWSPSYITKLKNQGKLVLDPTGKLVDVPATFAKLKETADPTKQGVRDHHAEQRLDRDVTQHVRHDAPFDVPEPPSGAEDPSDNENYWKAKARREATLADLAEIELAKARGDLVELQSVRRGLTEASRLLRDMILAVPNRIAGQVVACADAAAAQRLMREELRQALEQFSRLADDGIDKVIG